MLLRNALASPLKSSDNYYRYNDHGYNGYHDFVDLDSVPSPSMSPEVNERELEPENGDKELESMISPSGSAKTHAFFASPFASPPASAPLMPPPKPLDAPPQKRTLTADFFSLPSWGRSLPSPKTSAPLGGRRNFLNLDISEPDHEPVDPEVTPTPKHAEPAHDALPDGELEGELAAEGVIIRSSSSSSETSLKLMRPLGEGTFSSVWLARDLSSTALALKSRRSLRDLRKQATHGESHTPNGTSGNGNENGVVRSSSSSSRIMRRLRGGVSGTRPANDPQTEPDPETLLYQKYSVLGLGKAKDNDADRITSSGSIYLSAQNDDDSISRASSISFRSTSSSSHLRRNGSSLKRLVAVKLTLRGAVEGKKSRDEERERTRTRVSFVREVEILKHISHPNIPPLLAHLTTPMYHVLVLPFYGGGDLLDVINNEEGWESLCESTVKRIFLELCRAVAWMHSVGLVHRDIKLENVLLTAPLFANTLMPPSPTSSGFSSPTSSTFPSSASHHSMGSPLNGPAPLLSSSASVSSITSQLPLPLPTQPLVKLTDFGLSRFIDPSSPLLATRCGSEAYAAPELVVGGGRKALLSSVSRTNSLSGKTGSSPTKANGATYEKGPEGGYDARETDAWACGVVLYALLCRKLPFGEGPGEALGVAIGRSTSRNGNATQAERRHWLMKIAKADWEWPPNLSSSNGHSEDELRGPNMVSSIAARKVVERLLVRDPSRRAEVGEVLEDEWFHMEHKEPEMTKVNGDDSVYTLVPVMPQSPEKDIFGPGEEEDDDEESDESDSDLPQDGWLVDEEGIPRVAKEEVV